MSKSTRTLILGIIIGLVLTQLYQRSMVARKS